MQKLIIVQGLYNICAMFTKCVRVLAFRMLNFLLATTTQLLYGSSHKTNDKKTVPNNMDYITYSTRCKRLIVIHKPSAYYFDFQ